MVASVAGLGIPVLDGMDTVLHTTLILPYRNTLKGIYAMTIPSQHTRDLVRFYMVLDSGVEPLLPG